MSLAMHSSNKCHVCAALVFSMLIIGTQSVDNARAANSMLQSASTLVTGQDAERTISQHQAPSFRADADAQELQYVNSARGTAEHFLPTGNNMNAVGNLEIMSASIASGAANQVVGNAGDTLIDPITRQAINPNVQELSYVDEARGTAAQFLPTGNSMDSVGNLEVMSASIASGTANQVVGNAGETHIDPITRQAINPNAQELSYVDEARGAAAQFLPTGSSMDSVGNLEVMSASIASGTANQVVGNAGETHIDPITRQLINPNVQELSYVDEARGTAEQFLPAGGNLEIMSATMASGNANHVGNSGGARDYAFNAASIASGMAGQVGGLATAADLAKANHA